jgi:hypothetical protein
VQRPHHIKKIKSTWAGGCGCGFFLSLLLAAKMKTHYIPLMIHFFFTRLWSIALPRLD